MAGLRCSASTPADVALSAAVARTVLQLAAPANQRLLVREWSVFFDGVDTVGEPVEVRLYRQSDAGTMSGLTPSRLSAGAETPQGAASHSATAEPTNGELLRVLQIHPQTGYDVILPPDLLIEVPGGGRLGIVCVAAADVGVLCSIVWEE